MANPVDIRESFPTTESAAGAGIPLTSVQPGSAAPGTNGSVGFSFQDASGNVVLPQLDAMGRLPVTLNGAGTPFRAKGTVPGSVLSATGAVYSGMSVVCSIPVTVAASGKSVSNMHGTVQCRKDALFQLCYQDTVNTVVLDETILGPGQYSATIGLQDDDFFSVPASASAPAFIVRAGCFGTLSDMHSAIKVTTF